MSDAVIVALIGAVALIMAAVIGLTTRLLLQRVARAAQLADLARIAAIASTAAIVATNDGIFELGKQLDGRLSELLKTSTELSHAQGKAEGEQAQRDRHAEAQP